MRSFTYSQALTYIEKRGFGTKPDLSRIRALVEKLGHPEETFPALHVAGTNGKTSVTWMIASILAGHGLNAGAHTSPHLQTLRERFLLTGADTEGLVQRDYISKDDFARAVSDIQPYVDLVEDETGETVTYFELTTALAYEWMSNVPVAVGVVETGMGGRWDATNVINGEVAVLSHIAVDHERYLGSTPIENAREKVGIIKNGARVVSSDQDEDVLKLIRKTSRQMDASSFLLGEDFHLIKNELAVGGRVISVEGTQGRYDDVFVPLLGPHQGANAAVAIAACEQFFDRKLDHNSLFEGMGGTRSPGRMEIVRRDPTVLLDGAHNPDGAVHLVRALTETFGDVGTVLVIGILDDKDIRQTLEPLAAIGDRFIISKNTTTRAAAPEKVAKVLFDLGREAEVEPDLAVAIDSAIAQAEPGGMVVITGSLYTVGDARSHLLGRLD